ncbi:MAG: plasmid partition protein ParG [Acidithiobacillus ferrivorans]|nr:MULTISPECIES: plasmid partition protein ParG [Acidithiobacillus]MBU2767348.1 chromosome partitioning protein ParB [Acidithiobacillus ferrivorans]MBU2814276.1 chromosome partitioning protein ParB [Acidithiobacillus ferruginosus]MBU2823820.1 chromosome partitioning protein ParB [Acidithiobacillus ferrooxidans]MBU2806163.1 chromosome partitioning protein ParB [Acidithiobacillus ferridurans]MBU2844615.1 chromosome partitioning protein ParB [Acidithiobacillus ferriphilus]
MSKSLGLSAGRPSESRKAAALKAISDDKGSMVRVNFELDEAEHLKLKIFAAKARRSIAEILRELIDKNIPA